MTLWMRWLLLVTLCWAVATGPALAAQDDDSIGGFPAAEALRLGERMYRAGLLPNGEPMMAVVQGDIPVDGTMFSCESCHLRSGLGSIEGKVVTLPTNGAELYQDFTKAPAETLPPWERLQSTMAVSLRRPAYTDKTLAEALWAGVDPAGREFSGTMPRYSLSEQEMAILVHYLKQLSAQPAPGVTAETITFATVVSDQVPEPQRRAMLETLQAYFRDRNLQTRRQTERASKAPFYRKHMTSAYRRLDLKVWTLSGPPSGWAEQLAAYYEQAPVFALVGGIVEGSWAPIHQFCESRRLPSLFPVTDFPVVSATDWYTLYFSEGWYQEGETAARYLAGFEGDQPAGEIVLAWRDSPVSRALADGFLKTWAKLGRPPVAEVALPGETPVPAGFWSELAERHPGATLVAALEASDLAGLADSDGSAGAASQVVLFGGLLGDQLVALPEAVRARTLVTYPWRLPADRQGYMRVVEIWVKGRKLEVTDLPIQAKMYFVGSVLTEALMHLQSDYYRDFFLDIMDMMEDQYYTIANYPRLSFGQGQRYASKGCYLVQVGPGPEPELQPKTPWVVH